jgi:hypothetical protein
MIMNEVTAYGIFKVLRETTANALSEKAIARDANIDPTSENLIKIKDYLFDAAMEYEVRHSGDGKVWSRYWSSMN